MWVNVKVQLLLPLLFLPAGKEVPKVAKPCPGLKVQPLHIELVYYREKSEMVVFVERGCRQALP